MARCNVCHNESDKPLNIEQNSQHYIFDCFECAIHQLAPSCHHCGCIIIGHGVEAKGQYYCCALCARQSGISELTDHVN